MKNKIFVEANVRNNTAKFQLFPPSTSSEELIFEYVLQMVAMVANQIKRL